MKLNEYKKETLALIEELNPKSPTLTDDPDIEVKFYAVTNHVLLELCRIKKLSEYVEIPVVQGQVLRFEDISNECGREVYQVSRITGVDYDSRANGTVYKILETGTAEIDCFVFPERITEKTNANTELEISQDLLEILPYGVAADLLKSDESANYGRVYAERYELMKKQLDPRYKLPDVYISGGVDL